MSTKRVNTTYQGQAVLRPEGISNALLDALSFACRTPSCDGQMRPSALRAQPFGGTHFACSRCEASVALDHRGRVMLAPVPALDCNVSQFHCPRCAERAKAYVTRSS